jgi:hypothetical protein
MIGFSAIFSFLQFIAFSVIIFFADQTFTVTNIDYLYDSILPKIFFFEHLVFLASEFSTNFAVALGGLQGQHNSGRFSSRTVPNPGGSTAIACRLGNGGSVAYFNSVFEIAGCIAQSSWQKSFARVARTWWSFCWRALSYFGYGRYSRNRLQADRLSFSSGHQSGCKSRWESAAAHPHGVGLVTDSSAITFAGNKCTSFWLNEETHLIINQRQEFAAWVTGVRLFGDGASVGRNWSFHGRCRDYCRRTHPNRIVCTTHAGGCSNTHRHAKFVDFDNFSAADTTRQAFGQDTLATSAILGDRALTKFRDIRI